MIAQASLDAQIFRYMAKIADNTDLKTQLVKFLKQLTAKKPDPTEMSKEEFIAKIRRGEEDYRRGNTISFDTVEHLDKYIRGL